MSFVVGLGCGLFVSAAIAFAGYVAAIWPVKFWEHE